jgi:hypothetical protein
MKVNLTINGANLHLQSRGNIIKIDVDFLPSQQPGFTDFLDETYELRHIHNNNENKSGHYTLYIEDARFEALIYSITKVAEMHIDLKNYVPA